MEIIADWGTPLLILAAILGLYMAWGIGANDAPGAMGTSLGSGAITVKQAIIVAVLFEFGGAFVAGGGVTSTIGGGLLYPDRFAADPQLMVLGMLAALLGAMLWLKIAHERAWPVSTTHTIVGAIVGFALAGIGMDAVQWGMLSKVVASWVIAPVLGGFLALLLMQSVRMLILSADDPFEKAKTWGPVYLFFLGWVIGLVTLSGGVGHLGLRLTTAETLAAAAIIGVAAAIVGRDLINRVKVDRQLDQRGTFAGVERVFAPMMIFSAAAMAFAHGSNDVGNAAGPIWAVVAVVRSSGQAAPLGVVPAWILLLGAAGIIAGLVTLGYRVLQAAGTRITELTPMRGFCATLAAACTVALASKVGLPVSTTHVAVGAVMGVGLARGIGALDLRVIGNIIVSWIITLPAGACLAAVFYFLLTLIFG